MAVNLLKRFIPTRYLNMLRRKKVATMVRMLHVLAYSSLLRVVYYALVSPAFSREVHAVAYGRWKNVDNKGYQLRRNIHRIEKGLLMKEQRSIFATSYIEQTVECYDQLLRESLKKGFINEELVWAHDVLTLYFSVNSHDLIVDRQRVRFSTLTPIGSGEICHVPYKRDIENASPVSYEQLLMLSKRRKSIRWYCTDRTIPRESIDKAMLVAALSPSACNRQPYEFRIFDEKKLVQQISSLADGASGFSQGFPAIVVIIGRQRAYAYEWDRHLIYIDASLAAMSFMYALETLGIGSCPLNWPAIRSREAKMSELLGLEPDECVVMLISLGYPDPDAKVAYSQRKDLDTIRVYNAAQG
jgi:nitroreductase